MNESFGELSRPMRNRGIEIYLDDYDLEKDLEDMLIVLATLYPFNSDPTALEQLFTKIIEANLKNLHFSDMLKMLKLTHDYWLLNAAATTSGSEKNANLIIESFVKMLDDLKIHSYSSSGSRQRVVDRELLARISARNFHSQVFKLKEFKIYRYLFNFPLYPKFMQQASELLGSFVDSSDESQTSLQNYSKMFMNTVRQSQYMEIWLRQVPVAWFSLIFKCTRANLDMFKSNSFYQDRLVKFFDLINENVFNEKSNVIFKDFKQNLAELARTSSLDLSEEKFEPNSNRFLMKKFDKSSDVTWERLEKNRKMLKMLIQFYLSKFRIEQFYTIENNRSLVSIAEKIDSNLILGETSSSGGGGGQIVSLKFLSHMRMLYDCFFGSLINYFLLNDDKFNAFDQGDSIDTIYLIEKFYLICAACSFDNVLTLSYMKYYWSFIENGLKRIECALPE